MVGSIEPPTILITWFQGDTPLFLPQKSARPFRGFLVVDGVLEPGLNRFSLRHQIPVHPDSMEALIGTIHAGDIATDDDAQICFVCV